MGLTGADRNDELDDLAGDTSQDDHDANRRGHQPGLPGRIVVMLHAPCHAHQAEHVKRHERNIEADEPAPERCLPPTFIERKTERLWEPIIEPGHHAEYDAANDDVVEMGDEEQAVMQLEIRWRHSHQDPR